MKRLARAKRERLREFDPGDFATAQRMPAIRLIRPATLEKFTFCRGQNGYDEFAIAGSAGVPTILERLLPATRPYLRQFHQHFGCRAEIFQAAPFQRGVRILFFSVERFGVGTPSSVSREPSVPPRMIVFSGVRPKLRWACSA